MAKVFLNTNVFVYAADRSDPAKNAKAVALIKQMRRQRHAVISTQVLAELYSVATSKLGISAANAHRLISEASHCETVLLRPVHVLGAAELSQRAQISIWDALIVSAAKAGKCSHLYTEDLQDGQSFDGVTIVNPFTPSPERAT